MSSGFKQYLKRPYYANDSISYRLIQAFAFGAFVAIFLLVFQPFQFVGLGDNWKTAAINFGMITTGTMVIANVIVPLFFSKYFEPEHWTVGREMFYSTLNLFLIGSANALYFLSLVGGSVSWELFFWFQLITISVGIIPITFLLYFRERRDKNFYKQQSEELNSALDNKDTLKSSNEEIILIESQNQNDSIELPISEFLFAKSADNYIEVYTTSKRHVIRNTLSNLVNQLTHKPDLFRCHRSYLVNLSKVDRVSGNAQGYRLHLKEFDVIIPVSRKCNVEIKNALA